MGFMTGRKIYENFQHGQGPEGLSAGAGIVNELAAEYQEVSDAIRQLTAKMESVWQGDAAGEAQRGAGPLAVEHDLAGPHLSTAQDLTSRQAGSFADARNAVVPVPPEPTRPDPWAVFNSPGKVVTYQQQVAEYNAANQHNADVMTGYAGASSFNAKGMPQSYGSLTSDQAGIAVDSSTSDTGGGPRDGGPKRDDSSRSSGRGVAEWSDDSSRWVAPPPDAGGPSNPDPGPPSGGGGQPPQQTTPGGFTPAPTGPVAPVPVGGVGSGPPSGAPGGWLPGPGFVPVGGGLADGSGERGRSGGPGGRGAGAGPGSGSEVRGPGGRAGGGEPHGPGGRLGAGSPSGEPVGAGGRAGAAGPAGRGGGPMGGAPMAAGGHGRGEDDTERRSPDYLQEDDPEGLFGTDERTAPPVIGEDLEPRQPEQPSTEAE